MVIQDEWNHSLNQDSLWSNVNFCEAVTEPMTPLAWSVLDYSLKDWRFLPVNSTLGNINMAMRYTETRGQIYHRLMTLPSYPSIILGEFDPFTWASDPDRASDLFFSPSHQSPTPIRKAASNLVTGSPGSAGKVEGVARVIFRPENGDQLQKGEILIAVQTDIAWTVLFPRAAAVVTDVGAPLSHAAIVARELGIPAVVGCGNATTLIKTGDRLKVDGGRGTVEILSN